MIFLIGGFDEGEPYGKVFEVSIPGAPAASEKNPNDFGLTWGGQAEATQRLLLGYDQRALEITQKTLGLTAAKCRI